MIGYVLLITGALVMGGLIYAWMQTYVPRDTIECPSGVSMFIQESSCGGAGDDYTINLSIVNNGRFSIDGYFIKAADNKSHEIATIDISDNITSGGNPNSGLVLFSSLLDPGEGARRAVYGLNKPIYLVEIIPIRYEVIEGKNRLVSCGDAKVKEVINCPSIF